MSLRTSFLFVICWLAPLLSLGCFGERYATGGGKPGVVLRSDTRIAVLPFVATDEVVSLTAADMCVPLVLERHLGVVERAQLKEVLKELNLSMTDLIGGKGRKEVGSLLGADLLLIGNLPRFEDNVAELDFKGGFVHVSVKLCDVRSGDVVWAASGSKSIFGIADSHSAAIHLERLLRDMFKTFPPVK